MIQIRDVARRLVRHFSPQLACSACRRMKSPTVRVVSGPGLYLCEVCIRSVVARLPDTIGTNVERCQFCGARRPRINDASLARVRVCATCVQRMDDVLTDDERQ
jgi:hypothetical protein